MIPPLFDILNIIILLIKFKPYFLKNSQNIGING